MALTLQTFDQIRDAATAMGSAPEPHFVAGGTLLMRQFNEGRLLSGTLIRSTDPAFSEIRASGSRIVLGAGVTMSQIMEHRELRFLADVARSIGGPAVRNMATVGGNLFAPSPYGDFATALLALETTVAIQSGYSPRDVPLDEFLHGRDRQGGALVVSVSVRRPDSDANFRYLKVSRTKPKGAAVMTIAANLPVSGGRISSPRIAYGAMAPTPVRGKATEAALNGKQLDQSGIQGALEAAIRDCAPETDAIATEWYRREVLPVHLKRLLLGQ